MRCTDLYNKAMQFFPVIPEEGGLRGAKKAKCPTSMHFKLNVAGAGIWLFNGHPHPLIPS